MLRSEESNYDRFLGAHPDMDAGLPIHDGESPETRHRILELIEEGTRAFDTAHPTDSKDWVDAGRCAVRSVFRVPG